MTDLDRARALARELLEVLGDEPVTAPGIGPRAIALIKHFESCRLDAYKDAVGIWTIGWGETGPHIVQGLRWTQEQADASFIKRLAEYEAGVRKRIGAAPTLPREFGAMVSLAYNIGVTAFSGSTLAKLHVAGEKARASDEFLRWNKAGGQVLNGLARRRAAERALYLGNFDEVPA